MKKLLFPLLLALALSPMTACTDRAGGYTELAAGFRTPPDSVQTSVYWYWISGCVSVEGVEKDLEAMKRAGINRAFIGNIGLGDQPGPYEPVTLFSEEWWHVLRTALKKASELDIEIGMFNCPGWSQAGGPWIAPGQAMRYLTRVEAQVTGGRRVELPLPHSSADFQDVRVIAFPTPDAVGKTLSAADTRIEAAGVTDDPVRAIDGDPETELRFDGSSEVRLELTADAEFTLRSLTLYPSFRPIRADAELFVRENGAYRSLAAFAVDRSNSSIEVGFDAYAPISITTAPTRGREFRLVIRNAGRDAGIRELALSSVPRVERYAEKSLAKMFQSSLPYWEEYQWPEQPEPDDPSTVVRPEQVLDISGCLHGDRLEWDAPQGEWTVQRLGMLPTGVRNTPSAPEGIGLEVDKMTPNYLQHHFDSFIGAILDRIPAEERRTFRVVVADSYEKGGQNFTDTFLEEFAARYGYDPLSYLPVYGGTVVGSQELSDRFLWDMRRFAADRLAYAHIGGLREIAHRHGLTLWLENYGHWGFPGEFLQYGGQSDEVSGEFWSEGTLGDIENRAASSCAHIYGKNKVSAESFTAAGNDFFRHPALMKQRGDRFFSEGINNTLLHVYISQPDDLGPGMNAWFGNEFNRNNTWFSHMDLFTAYLKRCNFMLQQGLNVADVAYFIGEDAPKMTGIADPALPKGYQFDYINGEVLRERMTVRNGMWTLPHGTQYRMLVLPELKTMRPELLERLEELVRAGGILLGPAPQRSPSLEGYPRADERVRSLAASLWSGADGVGCKAVRHGKGAVLCGMTMEEALAYADCIPDCATGAEVPVLFGHRDAGEIQIYFLTNQSNERIDFSAVFRTSGSIPEWWDPVTGSVRVLPEFSDDGRTTMVPMALEPIQSGFVVFRRPDGPQAEGANFPAPAAVRPLDGPWTLTFEAGRRGPDQPVEMERPADLSRSDKDSIRYFSGHVCYETTFDLDEAPSGSDRLFLNTGEVGVMAKAYVNGRYAGGVWTWPYRVEITDRVHKGTNTLRLDLATTWVNRLIGDSMLPETERRTWTVNNPWRPASPLQPSGLLHPVVIEKYER